MSSRSRHSAAIPSTAMLVSDGWMSYIGRRMPFGRPVVPDEYIIGAPSCSSAIGPVLWLPTASSHDSNGSAGSPGAPTMIQRSTSGHSAGSSRATSALAADVTTTRDCGVVDDVGHLFGRQVRVDRREVEPGTLGAPLGEEHGRVVLHEDRHVVLPAQTRFAQHVRHLVRSGLVLGEGQHAPRRCHDDGRLIGMLRCVFSCVHHGPLGPTPGTSTACRPGTRP